MLIKVNDIEKVATKYSLIVRVTGTVTMMTFYIEHFDILSFCAVFLGMFDSYEMSFSLIKSMTQNCFFTCVTSIL